MLRGSAGPQTGRTRYGAEDACHVPLRDLSTCCKPLESTPDYSITSAACASRGAGLSRPITLAVLRLMTSSNLLGC
jgi:hypothetical protein